MDIAMGGMNGLTGGGPGMLDDWFLGDFISPYTGLQGDSLTSGGGGGGGGGAGGTGGAGGNGGGTGHW
jgi:hypothetical protein